MKDFKNWFGNLTENERQQVVKDIIDVYEGKGEKVALQRSV